MCVLYSASRLDIDDINRRIENAAGRFVQRVENVLGSKYVSNPDFSSSSVSFKAQSNASVVPVFVKSVHK